jgi:ribosome-associated protein
LNERTSIIELVKKPSGLSLAKLCREIALDKKALDPVIIDLRGISTMTDFFVILSAQSEPQIKAIANGIEKKLKDDYQVRPQATDGFAASQWIVVDYGDVLVHIFHETRRPVYALEELWGDAPKVK